MKIQVATFFDISTPIVFFKEGSKPINPPFVVDFCPDLGSGLVMEDPDQILNSMSQRLLSRLEDAIEASSHLSPTKDLTSFILFRKCHVHGSAHRYILYTETSVGVFSDSYSLQTQQGTFIGSLEIDSVDLKEKLELWISSKKHLLGSRRV